MLNVSIQNAHYLSLSTVRENESSDTWKHYEGKHLPRPITALDKYIFTYDAFDPYSLCGINHGSTDYTRVYRGSKPTSHISDVMQGAYANMVRLVDPLGQVDDSVRRKYPNEKDVTHVNLRGDVRNEGIPSFPLTHCDFKFRFVDDGSGNLVVQTLSNQPLFIEQVGDLESYVPDWIDEVNAGSFDYQWRSTYWHRSLFDNAFAYRLGDEYHLGFTAIYVRFGSTRYYDVLQYRLIFSRTLTPVEYVPGVAYSLNLLHRCVTTTEIQLDESNHKMPTSFTYLSSRSSILSEVSASPPPANPYDWTIYSSRSVLSDCYSYRIQGNGVDSLLGYDPATGTYADNGGPCLSAFSRSTKHLTGGVRAGAFFSAQDALNEFFESSQFNLIEPILEIREIFAPVSFLKGISVLILQKRLLGKGFLGLLDLLSEASLLWGFGMVPTVSDAETLAFRIRSAKRKFLDAKRYGPNTAHGTAKWVIDHSVTFPQLTVRARSKVRLALNLDGFLPYIIPVNSFGLLPTLSRVWAVIPYSWLIDMFIPVSNILEIIDTTVFNALFNIEYTVNSFVIDYEVPEEILQSHGIHNVSRDLPLKYRRYTRSVQKALPVFGPTVLPVLSTPGVTHWETFSAFIYTRLR